MSDQGNELESRYITVPEMAAEAGVTWSTVYGWLNYFRYLPFSRVLKRVVVRREDWQKFQGEHPELFAARKQEAENAVS